MKSIVCTERLWVWLVAVLVAVTVPAGAAESSFDFSAEYTKHEYRIPMRDGVELFTVVFTPKDLKTKFPILFLRTPYSVKPYTVDDGRKPRHIPEALAKDRYIFALQDVRGRYGSEGQFVDARPNVEKGNKGKAIDESSDAYDTIDWLVHHLSGHNGKVGMYGISYPGFYVVAGMIDAHPALKAVSPQAPAVDFYGGDDVLHGGGFWLPHNFGFWSWFEQSLDDPLHEEARGFNYRTPDGYEFFLHAPSLAAIGKDLFKGKAVLWDDMIAHITNATWCADRDLTRHIKKIKPAVLTVGGWFDAEDVHGTFKTYQAVATTQPKSYNGLVMGPWSHGSWSSGEGRSLGMVDFHLKTGPFFREQVELPFFRYFLKGVGKAPPPNVRVFETGNDQWREFETWPPEQSQDRALFLLPAGKLAFAPEHDRAPRFTEYISDPAHPVPFTARISTGMPKEYMVEDQRFASRRPDVLVFQTEPLSEEITVCGPLKVSLNVSTSGTDSDWIVKLIDVYTADAPNPDPNPEKVEMGHYQQLIRGEPLRGKYRNGYDRPEPFRPGEVTPLEWTMPDVFHTFKSGHRIMVQVQSTWFPLLDRNPQAFCDIYRAQPEDYRPAVQRIFHDAKNSSRLEFRVLPHLATQSKE